MMALAVVLIKRFWLPEVVRTRVHVSRAVKQAVSKLIGGRERLDREIDVEAVCVRSMAGCARLDRLRFEVTTDRGADNKAAGDD